MRLRQYRSSNVRQRNAARAHGRHRQLGGRPCARRRSAAIGRAGPRVQRQVTALIKNSTTIKGGDFMKIILLAVSIIMLFAGGRAVAAAPQDDVMELRYENRKFIPQTLNRSEER